MGLKREVGAEGGQRETEAAANGKVFPADLARAEDVRGDRVDVARDNGAFDGNHAVGYPRDAAPTAAGGVVVRDGAVLEAEQAAEGRIECNPAAAVRRRAAR